MLANSPGRMMTQDPSDTKPRLLGSLILLLGLFVIVAGLHSVQALISPVLAFEDGRDMLAYFFNHPEPRQVLRFYADYVSLIPNAVAWAGTKLPLTLTPYAFTFASLAFATLGFFMLGSDRYAWLVPVRRDRFIIAISLAVLPLGKELMVNNLAYSQWSLLFILILLMIRRPLPERAAPLVGWVLAVVLCIASHPLSLLVLPLCAFQFVVSKRASHRVAVGLCVVAVVLYQWLGVNQGGHGPPSPGAVVWALQVFLSRVLFEMLFGAQLATTLNAQGMGLAVNCVAGLILFGLVMMVLRGERPKRDLAVIICALLLAFAIVLLSTMTRYVGTEADRLYLESPGMQRYIYISKLIFGFLILWKVLPRVERFLKGKRAPAKAILICVFAVYVVGLNFHNRSLYGHKPGEGRKLHDFLVDVEADRARARRGEPHQAQHTLDRGGHWNVVLIIDRDKVPGNSPPGAP